VGKGVPGKMGAVLLARIQGCRLSPAAGLITKSPSGSMEYRWAIVLPVRVCRVRPLYIGLCEGKRSGRMAAGPADQESGARHVIFFYVWEGSG
jgi:hypothetical protein